MRLALTSMCAAALPLAASAAGNDAAACGYSAAPQRGRDACAAGGLGKADARLNRARRAIRIVYAGRAPFPARLKSAQKAWQALRDAENGSTYPGADGLDPQIKVRLGLSAVRKPRPNPAGRAAQQAVAGVDGWHRRERRRRRLGEAAWRTGEISLMVEMLPSYNVLASGDYARRGRS